MILRHPGNTNNRAHKEVLNPNCRGYPRSLEILSFVPGMFGPLTIVIIPSEPERATTIITREFSKANIDICAQIENRRLGRQDICVIYQKETANRR